MGGWLGGWLRGWVGSPIQVSGKKHCPSLQPATASCLSQLKRTSPHLFARVLRCSLRCLSARLPARPPCSAHPPPLSCPSPRAGGQAAELGAAADYGLGCRQGHPVPAHTLPTHRTQGLEVGKPAGGCQLARQGAPRGYVLLGQLSHLLWHLLWQAAALIRPCVLTVASLCPAHPQNPSPLPLPHTAGG